MAYCGMPGPEARFEFRRGSIDYRVPIKLLRIETHNNLDRDLLAAARSFSCEFGLADHWIEGEFRFHGQLLSGTQGKIVVVWPDGSQIVTTDVWIWWTSGCTATGWIKCRFSSRQSDLPHVGVDMASGQSWSAWAYGVPDGWCEPEPEPLDPRRPKKALRRSRRSSATAWTSGWCEPEPEPLDPAAFKAELGGDGTETDVRFNAEGAFIAPSAN